MRLKKPADCGLFSFEDSSSNSSSNSRWRLVRFFRRLDGDLDVEVAHRGLPQDRHALALEPELAAVLRSLRHLDAGLRAVERRHLEGAAERGRGHRDRNLAVEIGAVALEKLVRLDRQEDVEIAGRPAAKPGLAFIGKPDAGTILDAGRNV